MEGPIVGWVGRLSPEKGPGALLRAVTLIGRPQVRVSYLGDGSSRVALEEQKREMVAHGSVDYDRVRFHGNVANAGRLLKAFDVLVLSSRTEGTPMILFEAMGAEVPVVTTRVGGVPEVVTEQEAILVPSEDAGALARGIREVLDSPSDACPAMAKKKLVTLIRLERPFKTLISRIWDRSYITPTSNNLSAVMMPWENI